MTKNISWTDDYAIGIDEIDQQHKFLFKLINDTLRSDLKEQLQISLLQLYKYTREHFTAEESLMKEICYPQYKQHRELHNQLITELNKKSKEALNDPTKRDKLDNFLVSWLIVHIIGEDIHIGEFFKR
ncbi:bacteriohemerythrin [Psychromonas antarctica]|uniref:bacteriohemerythrin n=1 Tax=Psychromonas antarctica TaxID=67573 RepID=UPI001EE86C30|nr:bacteriohemerythrin [Psychromonas antarctica]MCG6202089.1 bacteriohemerythrin [Psychromonas antarctica]